LLPHPSTLFRENTLTSATLPLVSIVLATYNRSAVLGRAIDSVLGQTYSCIEVVVVNDNSPDHTNDLLDAYERQHPSFRSIRLQQNVGPGKARNLAIAQAQGKYVAIMDDDDICVNTRLEKQVAFLENNPTVDLCFGLVQWFDDAQGPIRVLPGKLRRGVFPVDPPAVFRLLLLEDNYIPNQTLLGKREVFIQYPYAEDVRLGEDWYQVLAMSANGVCIRGIPEILTLVDRSRNREGLMTLQRKLFAHQHLVLQRISQEVKLSRWMRRQAFSNQYVREARTWSRWRGISLLLRALLLNPANGWAYRTLAEIALRGVQKAKKRLVV